MASSLFQCNGRHLRSYLSFSECYFRCCHLFYSTDELMILPLLSNLFLLFVRFIFYCTSLLSAGLSFPISSWLLFWQHVWLQDYRVYSWDATEIVWFSTAVGISLRIPIPNCWQVNSQLRWHLVGQHERLRYALDSTLPRWLILNTISFSFEAGWTVKFDWTVDVIMRLVLVTPLCSYRWQYSHAICQMVWYISKVLSVLYPLRLQFFLANSRSRSLYAIARPSVCRL